MMKITLKQWLLLALLLLIVGAAGLAAWRLQKNEPEVAGPVFDQHFSSTSSVPASFRTLTGEVATPSLREAKLTVVTSWASWSPYTATEFAVISGLRAQYTSEELNLILLNRRETPTQANRYLEQNPAPLDVTVVIDDEDTFYNQIEGYTMPETVVYNQQGEVVLHLRGPLSHDRIVSLLATSE